MVAPQICAAQEPDNTNAVVLIQGLDGGSYEPYSPAVVEKVQGALKDKGLYQGEVNGKLDEATMKAIGEFQKANQLTAIGRITPAGSHSRERRLATETFRDRPVKLLSWDARGEEMNRRIFFGFCLSAVAAAGPVFAAAHDDDEREKHGGKHGRGRADHHFRPEDARYLRQYYRGPADLPPGLRKKYYRTGKLPPGWEKRLQPFPPVVVQRLPPLPPNCGRGYLDGFAVVYDRRTRVILDVMDLIGAVAGR